MEIKLRRAEHKDIDGIMRLLHQVNDVHAEGRPDLFRPGKSKYSPEEVKDIIECPLTPVFVAVDCSDQVAGYCFCIIEDHAGSNNLTPVSTLYIDDLCVDEKHRGEHIGRQIYEYVRDHAKEAGYYNLTLNVWSCNPSAQRFYESLGLKPYKIGMEAIL